MPDAPSRTPATRHAPRPWRAVFWWLSPLLVVVPAVVVFGFLASWFDDPANPQSGGRDFLRIVAIVVPVVLALVCWYRPYGYLASTTEWVGGDGGKARRWFWVPIGVSMLAAVANAFIAGAAQEGRNDGAITTTDGLTAWLQIVMLFLPTIAWVLLGHRAMRELEQATAMTSSRTLHGGGDLDPALVTERFRLAREAGLRGNA